MDVRQVIIAALLCAFPSSVATVGEPVVKGSFHTIVFLGQNCLTVPKAETYLRPGTRLEMHDCQNSPEQIFEWNVLTFEIKSGNLCVDAFRAGGGPSQPGDPVGLWYCQQSPQQKWYPDYKDKNWLEAFNIVGGGSPSSELCLSIASDKDVDGAQLTIQKCDSGDQQWLRLYSWPPLQGQLLSQRLTAKVLKTFLATTAAPMKRQRRP
jgi:hypothetical protein